MSAAVYWHDIKKRKKRKHPYKKIKIPNTNKTHKKRNGDEVKLPVDYLLAVDSHHSGECVATSSVMTPRISAISSLRPVCCHFLSFLFLSSPFSLLVSVLLSFTSRISFFGRVSRETRTDLFQNLVFHIIGNLLKSPTSHRDTVGKSSSQARKPMRKQEFESRWNSHLKVWEKRNDK